MEITLLKKKNDELIENLKRLNEQLNIKVTKFAQEKEKIEQENPNVLSAKIEHETECLKQFIKNYEIELEQLKNRLNINTDTITVVKIERKLNESKENNGKLLKKIKYLEKEVKDQEKLIEKSVKRIEDGVEQFEVYFFL